MQKTCRGAVAALAGCAVAAAAGSQQLTIQVWLKPDLAGATAFADSVATPGSAAFHQYLSPNAYTARFGPSAAHATATTAWLTFLPAGLAARALAAVIDQPAPRRNA